MSTSKIGVFFDFAAKIFLEGYCQHFAARCQVKKKEVKDKITKIAQNYISK